MVCDLTLEKATILPVETRLLDYYWPFVVNYIQDALEHSDGEVSLGSIYADIANQKKQLWVIKHRNEYLAGIVTDLITYEDNGLKVGQILFAGGKDHHLWDHFTETVGEWFKENGCHKIEIVGRMGWKRLYEKKGFKPAYLILRKDL